MGENEKAIEYYNKSLEIKIRGGHFGYRHAHKAHGQNHPDVAATQYNIGNLLYNQAKLGEALDWYKKSLATRVKVLGPEHPDVAKTKVLHRNCASFELLLLSVCVLLQGNIGIIFEQQGKLDDAEKI